MHADREPGLGALNVILTHLSWCGKIVLLFLPYFQDQFVLFHMHGISHITATAK
jgi:hypothetical protein